MQANAEAVPLVAAVAVAKPKLGSAYLVSPSYDLSFFILAPSAALLLTIVLGRIPLSLATENMFDTKKTWAALFIGVWTNAHLIAVVFRSHANREVFQRFHTRFTWVPLALVFYVLAYAWLMRRHEHRMSGPKLGLLASTAIVSIFAWAFLPPFQAFFIVNFFHGLQYFAIVWATEKRTLQRLLARSTSPASALRAFAFAAAIVVTMGTLHTLYDVPALRLAFAFFTVVSLMHFWYDGFIWSVRRAEVKASE